MCTPEIGAVAGGGMIGMNAMSAYEGAKAERERNNYEATIADSQAVDAVQRGGLAANEVRIAGRRLQGKQVAAAAAGGVDVKSGVARQLQQETEFLTEQDVATIRTNASRQAWGYRQSANMSRAVAKASSPGRAAGMSILSDATQIGMKMALGV